MNYFFKKITEENERLSNVVEAMTKEKEELSAKVIFF